MRTLRISAGVVLVVLLVPVVVLGIAAERLAKVCDSVWTKGRVLAERWLEMH